MFGSEREEREDPLVMGAVSNDHVWREIWVITDFLTRPGLDQATSDLRYL